MQNANLKIASASTKRNIKQIQNHKINNMEMKMANFCISLNPFIARFVPMLTLYIYFDCDYFLTNMPII